MKFLKYIFIVFFVACCNIQIFGDAEVASSLKQEEISALSTKSEDSKSVFSALKSLFYESLLWVKRNFVGYDTSGTGVALSNEWINKCFATYKESSSGMTHAFAASSAKMNTIISPEDFNEKIKLFNQISDKNLGTNNKQPFVAKMTIPSGSKICLIGDIHGSLHSLLRNLLRLQKLGYLNENFKVTRSNFYMVFLGDYTDRGRYGVEVLYALLSLKLLNWNQIFLMRGNHESEAINEQYGFRAELNAKFQNLAHSPENIEGKETLSSDVGWEKILWKNILLFYKNIPLAMFIKSGDGANWVQCCHGGIEPTFNPQEFLSSSDQYFNISSYLEKEEACIKKYTPIVKDFYKTFSVPDCGFNWCDFFEYDASKGGWGEIYSNFNNKYGRGYQCNALSLKNEFLNLFGLKAIFRGHQHHWYGLKIGGINDVNFQNSHWKNFVKLGETDIKIASVPVPLFTFSTASEGVGLPYDCFGILTTADKFEDWVLTPYEFELPVDRNNKYVQEITSSGELPTFRWSY